MRYTDPLPLRTSADLGEYAELYTLPRVLGTCIISPVRYDGSGHLWLLSDGVIGGVDQVVYQGRVIEAWALQQSTDDSGHAVAVLETQEQIENPADLSITLRGELHPDTGESLDRPDLQLWYLLSELGGKDIDQSNFDELRAWGESNGIVSAGVIDDHTISLQTWADRICSGTGLAWSCDLTAVAIPWPPDETDAVYTLTERQAPVIRPETNAYDIVTVVEVLYDYDWSKQDHQAAIRLSAADAVTEYGEIVKQIDRGWLHDSRSAIEAGERYLQWYSRPLWKMSVTAPIGSVTVGDWITIDHTHSPITTAVCTRRRWQPTGLILDLVGPYGSAETIALDSRSTIKSVDEIPAPTYQYNNGTATWTITDTDGDPIPGARVTLDNSQTRTADQDGTVQFDDVAAGQHTLTVEAVGQETRSIQVIVS